MTFRVLLAVIVIAVELVRAYFRRGAVAQRSPSRLEAAVIGLLSLLWLMSIVTWIAVPSVLAPAQLELPVVGRWLGVVLTLASVAGLVWIHRALGTNFSPLLEIKGDHQLVTSGPYRWVRHPMYLAFAPLMAGYFLISANAYVGISGAALLLALVALRVPNEERMLRARFGEMFDAYARRTGRVLPRLGSADDQAP